MNIQEKGSQQVSPKALERIMSALAAIERENPQIDWDKYGAYITVRKFIRFRWISIFPHRRVFLDICERPKIDRETETLTIPAGIFGEKSWKKRPVAVHGGPKWAFRMLDLKTTRKRRGKVIITLKEEGR